jgi:hypothetical protein
MKGKTYYSNVDTNTGAVELKEVNGTDNIFEDKFTQNVLLEEDNGKIKVTSIVNWNEKNEPQEIVYTTNLINLDD